MTRGNRLLPQSRYYIELGIAICDFKFVIVLRNQIGASKNKGDCNYNSLIVSVIAMLRMRFAGTRLTDNRNKLALGDGEGGIFQSMNCGFAGSVCFGDILNF